MPENLILAIDPGTTQSGYVLWDGTAIAAYGKIDNCELFQLAISSVSLVLIEMVQCMGQSIGSEVLETCVLIGRLTQYFESLGLPVVRVFRGTVKHWHAPVLHAGDKHVRQSLISKYGAKGTKKSPGVTYGLSGTDIWAAFALAAFWTETEAAGIAKIGGLL